MLGDVSILAHLKTCLRSRERTRELVRYCPCQRRDVVVFDIDVKEITLGRGHCSPTTSVISPHRRTLGVPSKIFILLPFDSALQQLISK